ncbi:MAG TPA: RagB/SusD family nutrient uptake outer membrane protein [Puia sp.]|nr:RagB/SusD family nutrient uptake outer membrane protein [Puia sp.]
MKNYQLRPLYYILLAGMLWGCKKELNVYPTTSEVDGNVIVDAKSAATALNGVYYQFADAGLDVNSVPSIKWSDLNEAIPSELSGLLTNSSGGTLNTHSYKASSYEAPLIWTYGYAIVNAANGFLKNIEPVTSITDSVKQEMMAEAKFLRAYANSELLLYYGQYYNVNSAYGIILRNEFVTPDNIQLPRSTVQACYDSIVSDLNTAIADLPPVNTQIAYATSWAAKLLMARVLINRGVSGDYAQVISLTNDLITNGPFALESSLQNLFWTRGLTSTEVILGVQPYATQDYKYSNYQFYAQYVPSDSMMSLFNGDPRLSWIAETVAAAYGTQPELTKYYPGSVTTIAPTAIAENSYALRLTEAYLLEAEALTLSGGSLAQAKTLLETVLSNAGVTDLSAVEAQTTAAGLQLQIVEEEMRNFVGEAGQDWYALRRLPLATVQAMVPTLGSQDLYILPIPLSEMTANEKMVQNPNY